MSNKNELLKEWRNTLKHCLGVLETAANDPQQLTAVAEQLDFTGRDEDNLPGPSQKGYADSLLNAYYITRYGLAYSFEYSLIYEAILKDYCSEKQSSTISVASFGCGSMIDAFSLAYAKKKLEEEQKINNLNIKYHGFDGARWNQYFAGENAVSFDENGKSTGKSSCVNDCFCISDGLGKTLENMPWINDFSEDGKGVGIDTVFQSKSYLDIIGDCNVLFFPKIINELDEKTLTSLISGIQDAFKKGVFKQKEIYIAISHSYSNLYPADNRVGLFALMKEEPPKITDNRYLIENIYNEIGNRYDVTGDVLEKSPLFDPEGKKDINRFVCIPTPKSKEGELQKGKKSELHKAYQFFKENGQYGPYSGKITEINSDFGGEVINEIKSFDKYAIDDLEIQKYKKMITNATYCAMQVIKLTKRN